MNIRGGTHATGGYFQTKSYIRPLFYILCYGVYMNNWPLPCLCRHSRMCLKCGTGPGRDEQHIMLIMIAADFKLPQRFLNTKMLWLLKI